MKRHILLSGEIGAGKTTLIRRALGGRLRLAGGFATVRVMRGGVLEGFELVPVPELLLEQPRGARFLDFTRGTAFSGDAFRTLGVQLLREARSRPFAVIDEIGGMELVTPVFRGELESFLASDIPWICVLKTAGAVSRLEAFAATGRDFAARAGELREELLSSGDTQEVTVRTRGDADALGALTSWAQEYAMQSR